MSDAECLFITRYFPFLIGNQDPQGNELYGVYLILRKIVNMVMSPFLSNSSILQDLITEHNH